MFDEYLIFVVDAVQALCLGAVKVVPEVAGQEVLVEDCPGRAEEGELLTPPTAHMEQLAPGLGVWVSIESPEHAALAPRILRQDI